MILEDMKKPPDEIDYSQEAVIEKMKQGYIPAVFRALNHCEFKEGETLIFKVMRQLPAPTMKNLVENFSHSLSKMGLRGMFLPPDVDLVGVIEEKKGDVNAG